MATHRTCDYCGKKVDETPVYVRNPNLLANGEKIEAGRTHVTPTPLVWTLRTLDVCVPCLIEVLQETQK